MRVLSFSWPPVRVRPGAPIVTLTCGFTPDASFAKGPIHALLTSLKGKLLTLLAFFGHNQAQLMLTLFNLQFRTQRNPADSRLPDTWCKT